MKDEEVTGFCLCFILHPSRGRETAVADEAVNSPNPFDVETIRQLVALMSEHDLSEVSLRQGDARLRLRRGVPVSGVVTPTPIVPAVHSGPSPAAHPAAPSAAEASPFRP